MTIFSSGIEDKSSTDNDVIIHTHTEDGREEIRFEHGAIAHILGRYAVEKFPEVATSGSVYIQLTTDDFDQPLVIVTECEK